MEIYAISGLINGITAISLGLLVLFRGWKSRVNQLFALMTFSYSLWSICYWQWLLSHDLIRASLWMYTDSIGSIFIPIFFFHWITVFLNEERKHTIFIVAIYLVGMLCLFLNSSRLFIDGFSHKLFFDFWPNAGSLYWIYIMGIYVVPVFYGLFLLLRAYKCTLSSVFKHQIIYIVVATVIGFGGGLTNFFLWYGVMIPPYGDFITALFPFLLAYAILKHHLFNIKVIAVELSVFVLWIFILIRTILVENIRELVIQSSLLVLAIIFGLMLIRGVLREIKDRKKIEGLASDLKILNSTLADKVAEQTREIRHSYDLEKRARLELEKLNDAKDQFILMTQHQLRAPVSNIAAELESMSKGAYGALPDGMKAVVADSRASTNRLTRVVNDFLNITAIKPGSSILSLSSCSLKPAVEGILAELKTDIEVMDLKVSIRPMIQAGRH